MSLDCATIHSIMILNLYRLIESVVVLPEATIDKAALTVVLRYLVL